MRKVSLSSVMFGAILGATVVTIGAANIKTAGYQFGATKLRAGEVGFVATRKFTAGVQQPLFVLASAS